MVKINFNDVFSFRNALYYSGDNEFERADIEIKKGKIHRILSPNTTQAREWMDASELVIFPGLINPHLHPSKELYGGIKDFCDLSGILDMVHKNNQLEQTEVQLLSSEYAMLNSIKQGITTIGIFTSRAEADAQKAKESGIRAMVHFSQNDRWIAKEHVPSMTTIKNIKERYHSCVDKQQSDLVSIHPATASELSASPELMSELWKIAKNENKKFALHISEGISQLQQCIAYYGKSGVQVLDELKIIDENLLLIHASSLLSEDINILSHKKTNFIHCPVSNSFTGSGIFPFKKLSGSIIGIGTDAAMVNPLNKLSFDAALSLYYHGSSDLNEKITSAEIINSITKDAACALGFENLGVIQEGYLADFCFFQKSDVFIRSKTSSLEFLKTIFNHSPSHVMINGGFVLYEDKITGKDYNQIEQKFLNIKSMSSL